MTEAYQRSDVLNADKDDGEEIEDDSHKQEQEQKKRLNKMKQDEYLWYKRKMIAATILVPVVYVIFYLLMKYAKWLIVI